MLIGLPWALLLFVLFPRLDRPRRGGCRKPSGRGRHRHQRHHEPGQREPADAVHRRRCAPSVEGEPLPASALYWRALVLRQLDGQDLAASAPRSSGTRKAGTRVLAGYRTRHRLGARDLGEMAGKASAGNSISYKHHARTQSAPVVSYLLRPRPRGS
ncbi:transglutaminaseTgpA domain-containing protein [Cupriavidus basilensis]